MIDWVSQTESVKTFSDPKFADGTLLIRLCAKIDPSSVSMDLVKQGQSAEDKELNAKYAIAVARKLGATLFLVWDDIINLNKKMILIFVAQLYDLS